MGFGEQFKGLDLETLIAVPLSEASQASVSLARTTADFIDMILPSAAARPVPGIYSTENMAPSKSSESYRVQCRTGLPEGSGLSNFDSPPSVVSKENGQKVPVENSEYKTERLHQLRREIVQLENQLKADAEAEELERIEKALLEKKQAYNAQVMK